MAAEPARMLAGTGIFAAVGVGAAIAARGFVAARRRLPGLGLLDRLGGAAAGLVLGVFLVTFGVVVARLLPIPALDEQLDDSAVAELVVDPTGPVARVFGVVVGDRMPGTLAAVEALVGHRAIVLASPLPLPETTPRRPDRAFAEAVFEEMNRRRVVEGVPTLSWWEPFVPAALAAADAHYAGRVPESLEARLDGVVALRPVEVAVLAVSPAGALEAIEAAAPFLVEDPDLGRVGVGAVTGPFGTVAVLVVAR
ncbi:MAG TPA: hypothetical protein ENK55_01695 [Actinobacteria bacterium]|nr:hypothetical protein [Actinomycetota bacterium]